MERVDLLIKNGTVVFPSGRRIWEGWVGRVVSQMHRVPDHCPYILA